MSLRRCLMGCLLGMATALLAHAQDSAHLRFAWPDRLVAQIQYEKTKSKQTNGQPPVVDGMASQYVMRAQRQGRQHIVSFSDLRMDANRLATMPPEARAVMDLLAKAALPSFVVSNDGDFVGLENPSAFQASMRSTLYQLIPEGPTRERLNPVLEGLLSESTLQSLAQTDWSWQVSAWSGGENALDIGDEYVAETRGLAPLVNALVTQRTHFKLARKLPCEREGQVHECVELQASIRPDEAEMNKAIITFMNKLSPSTTPPRGEKDSMALSSAITIELVTETATLIPHRYRRSKDITVSTVEAGKANTIHQIETTEQTFQYRQPD
jgi:hypothetical protein